MVRKEIVNIIDSLKLFFADKKLTLDKILLFGSHSKGTETVESDIDLIIVSKSFRRKNIFQISQMINGIDRMLIKKLDKPVDILYYSDKEWEKGEGLIINAAKQEGIVLYG